MLLTHDDLANRNRYLNARSTLNTLLGLGVVPVINENDTVATEEIRFGDNDTLAALVANPGGSRFVGDPHRPGGLYERDPRQDETAKLVHEGAAGDARLLDMAGGSGSLGRGGMRTKLLAAERAAHSGAATVIVPGREANVLARVLGGEGGRGYASAAGAGAARGAQAVAAAQARVAGIAGAGRRPVRVIRESGKSLLPVGVKAVEGSFTRGEIVARCDAQGREVARGLVNYGAEDARRIIGKPSDRIESILGYVDEPGAIHRDNMVRRRFKKPAEPAFVWGSR